MYVELSLKGLRIYLYVILVQLVLIYFFSIVFYYLLVCKITFRIYFKKILKLYLMYIFGITLVFLSNRIILSIFAVLRSNRNQLL